MVRERLERLQCQLDDFLERRSKLYWYPVSPAYLLSNLCQLVTVHSMALAEIRVFVSNFVRRFELDEFVDDFNMRECMVAESDTSMRMSLRSLA